MPELCYLVHVTWHQVIPSVLMRPKWPGIYATVPGCVVEMLKNCTLFSLVQKYSPFLVVLDAATLFLLLLTAAMLLFHKSS